MPGENPKFSWVEPNSGHFRSLSILELGKRSSVSTASIHSQLTSRTYDDRTNDIQTAVDIIKCQLKSPLLPHVRVTKCVLSENLLVCQLGLVREAL